MVKISALPPMASPDGADPAPIVDDSVSTTKKITLTQVKTWLITQLTWITGGMLVSGTIKNTQIDYTTAGKIWWEELGRTTLASAGDTITVSGFTARKYLRLQISLLPTGNVGGGLRYNNDSGVNYAFRFSDNGGGDSTLASQDRLYVDAVTTGPNAIFAVADIINIAAQEKITGIISNQKGSTGAANVPNRRIAVGKWSNTSAQISRVDIINSDTGDYAAGSELVVLGHD